MEAYEVATVEMRELWSKAELTRGALERAVSQAAREGNETAWLLWQRRLSRIDLIISNLWEALV